VTTSCPTSTTATWLQTHSSVLCAKWVVFFKRWVVQIDSGSDKVQVGLWVSASLWSVNVCQHAHGESVCWYFVTVFFTSFEWGEDSEYSCECVCVCVHVCASGHL
jgi:hypothetical protein